MTMAWPRSPACQRSSACSSPRARTAAWRCSSRSLICWRSCSSRSKLTYSVPFLGLRAGYRCAYLLVAGVGQRAAGQHLGPGAVHLVAVADVAPPEVVLAAPPHAQPVADRCHLGTRLGRHLPRLRHQIAPSGVPVATRYSRLPGELVT